MRQRLFCSGPPKRAGGLRAQLGISLIEIIVVIAIIGILSAAAFPSMSILIRTQKVRSAAYDLFADLTYARGEAISRGRDVLMFSAGGGNDWIGGWTIRDANGAVLRIQGQGSSGMVFTADAASVTFERNGRTSAGIVSFTIRPTDATAPDDQKRCVRIDPSGRARTANGVCS
jgi:prepilin-type N-terminal cleavage/methylation domain-containing protein